MTKDQLYAYGLLKMCEDLHMHFTGSAAFLSDDTLEEMRSYMIRRLEEKNGNRPVAPEIKTMICMSTCSAT